jgi:hypothetical protein
MKKRLMYGKTFPAVSDDEAEYIASKLAESSIAVSTANVVTAARALIKEGKLNHEDIVFVHSRPDGSTKEIPVDKNGKLAYHPEGFCDHNLKVMARLAKS